MKNRAECKASRQPLLTGMRSSYSSRGCHVAKARKPSSLSGLDHWQFVHMIRCMFVYGPAHSNEQYGFGFKNVVNRQQLNSRTSFLGE